MRQRTINAGDYLIKSTLRKRKEKSEVAKLKISFLVQVAADEEEEYLREKGVLKTFTGCPYCGINTLGRLEGILTNATDVKENGVQER